MRSTLAIISFAFSSLILCSTTSCSSTSAVTKTTSDKSGEIPPDMANEKFILVGVYHGRFTYDGKIRREFAAYTGQYVLSTKKELTTTYADPVKYRYVLDAHLEESGGSVTENTKWYSLSITDRKTGKVYYGRSRSSRVAKQINAYLKAIEAARMK